MFDIMNQAKDTIQAYNSALSINSANIANMSVNGYKRLDISFESIFNKLINSGTAADAFSNLGGTNPTQYGGGAAVAEVGIDFSQGSFVAGSDIDLAITGNGLFIVSPDGGSTYRYTRAGDFSINNGNLVTAAGHQVYGFNSAGSLVPISGLNPDANNYSWTTAGVLQYNSADTVYSIALTYFTNPQGLAQGDGTTFIETLASGTPSSPVGSGSSAGSVTGGSLEQSNVFYLGETIDSLEIQRALSGNLSVVRMASDIINNFITKLG
ncbi:flagellar hook basal-body protein [Candidatus Margulisiibacteriota bacterium]